jgi:hypothetical protein
MTPLRMTKAKNVDEETVKNGDIARRENRTARMVVDFRMRDVESDYMWHETLRNGAL